MLKLFPGNREVIGTFVIPTAILLVFLLLPFLDRLLPRKLAHFLACGFVFAIAGGAGYLLVQALLDDARNPEYRTARQKADGERDCAIYLAGLPDVGVPPDGSGYVLRRDPWNARTESARTALSPATSSKEKGPASKRRRTSATSGLANGCTDC